MKSTSPKKKPNDLLNVAHGSGQKTKKKGEESERPSERGGTDRTFLANKRSTRLTIHSLKESDKWRIAEEERREVSLDLPACTRMRSKGVRAATE